MHYPQDNNDIKKYNAMYYSTDTHMTARTGTAPDFTAPDQYGGMQTLSSYLGTWVVLYFYPKDDTPGCTKEACNFRDHILEFQKRGIVILGVSKDSVASHKKFSEKYHLTFPILSDEKKEIILLYRAWGTKTFMGRTFEGIRRMTYLIDPKGKIKNIYETVNPLTHAEEILKDIASLGDSHTAKNL